MVLMEAYENDWDRYLEALYKHFKNDFVDSRPKFNGQNIQLKRYPIERGKEATFWHLISQGQNEETRLPDFRRCERIRWPRPLIERFRHESVRCWTNRRRGEIRFLIALADFSYVTILSLRKGYLLLWTAYFLESEHQRIKLSKDYLRSLTLTD